MTRLGSTDIEVLPIALGANPFGWTADRDASFAILDAFVAAGGSLVDTSDSYSAFAPGNSGGESETIIGEWLAERGARDRIVLATKVSRHPDFRGLAAETVRGGAEASLRRLQTDRIDVYFAHYDDPDTPLEETVGAFAELVDRGVVGHVGLSNYTAERIREWLEVADRLGVARPAVLQPHYSLLVREPFESELRPVAEAADLGVMPYWVLAAGFLTGKYRSAADAADVPRGSMVEKYLTDAGFAVVDELRVIAGELGVEPASVALAWLRDRPGVSAPIASASRVGQLDALLRGATLELDAAAVERLERASAAFADASR